MLGSLIGAGAGGASAALASGGAMAIPGAVIGAKEGAAIGIAVSRAVKAGVRSLGAGSSSGGGGRTEAVERKFDTSQGQNEYWDELKRSGEWEQKPGFSKATLENKRTGDMIQKSREKWELEVFNRHGQHKGIIRPSEGVIRSEFAKAGRKIQ